MRNDVVASILSSEVDEHVVELLMIRGGAHYFSLVCESTEINFSQEKNLKEVKWIHTLEKRKRILKKKNVGH